MASDGKTICVNDYSNGTHMTIGSKGKNFINWKNTKLILSGTRKQIK